jgi:hypothetical protein
MLVELLTFKGCPNAQAAGELARRAIDLEAVAATLDFIEVDSPEVAQRLQFLGSPSLRIDGEDVEPSASQRTAYGLMCRTYSDGARVVGTPSIGMIREAIRRRAVVSADMLRNGRVAGVVFGLPILALIAGGLPAADHWRAAIWVVALATMGLGCITNAHRCGRVHCYLTGPFFLIMAVIAFSYAVGVLPLGTDGWNVLGVALLVGFPALYFLPEFFVGRYRGVSRRREAPR